MEFQSKEQFIGDMPEQYTATIKGIRKMIAVREKQLAECEDTAVEGAKLAGQIVILRDMLDDMTRAKRTVEGYYAGDNCDDAYTCIRRMKASKHANASYEAYLLMEATDNSDYIRGLKRALRSCIKSSLTDKQRKALIWCEYRGLTQEQTAQKLGISQVMIHKHLGAARKKIGKKLSAVAQNRL
ncbi:MAG: sigma factor-like helix-turn-helix DNA-binding protein [Clostridia bacterium]|nr:sigma factor-like helix-turn-helix DNA-binding protein [Clostridia bacterium]